MLRAAAPPQPNIVRTQSAPVVRSKLAAVFHKIHPPRTLSERLPDRLRALRGAKHAPGEGEGGWGWTRDHVTCPWSTAVRACEPGWLIRHRGVRGRRRGGP